jgi:threonine/homoserine/homoserine lactone efflux protein
MFELIAKIVPILLVDFLNPVLFAMLVAAAGTSRPVANSSAMLAGHTLSYFVAGVGVALGFEQVAERLANPHDIDYGLSAALGIALLWMALRVKKDGAPAASEPEGALTPAGCFMFGAAVNFVGIPFAIPYFAVVDQILSANLSVAGSLTVLAVYNIAYAVPFIVVPVAVAISGEQAKPFLEKISGFLGKLSDIAMPWLFGLLGLVLVADSAAYLFSGEGLIQF